MDGASVDDLPVEALNGETVDQLVWRVLGLASPAVERVLAANPQIADAGQFLTLGQRVVIPAAARRPTTAPMTQLWT